MSSKPATITCVAVALASAAIALADNPMPTRSMKAPAKTPMKTPQSAMQTRDEINQTIGFVPEFVKAMPDSFVSTFWTGMKEFQMNPNTALDAKTKELIGLGVASQIPCEYCISFHTIAARNAGANDQEIKEAVGMAGMTRMASTLLNGLQIDKVQFKRDVDHMMSKEQRAKAQARLP